MERKCSRMNKIIGYSNSRERMENKCFRGKKRDGRSGDRTLGLDLCVGFDPQSKAGT